MYSSCDVIHERNVVFSLRSALLLPCDFSRVEAKTLTRFTNCAISSACFFSSAWAFFFVSLIADVALLAFFWVSLSSFRNFVTCASSVVTISELLVLDASSVRRKLSTRSFDAARDCRNKSFSRVTTSNLASVSRTSAAARSRTCFKRVAGLVVTLWRSTLEDTTTAGLFPLVSSLKGDLPSELAQRLWKNFSASQVGTRVVVFTETASRAAETETFGFARALSPLRMQDETCWSNEGIATRTGRVAGCDHALVSSSVSLGRLVSYPRFLFRQNHRQNTLTQIGPVLKRLAPPRPTRSARPLWYPLRNRDVERRESVSTRPAHGWR